MSYGEFTEVIDHLFDLNDVLTDDGPITTEFSDDFSTRTTSIINLLASLEIIEPEDHVINLHESIVHHEFSLALDRLSQHDLIEKKFNPCSGIAVLMYHRFYDEVGKEHHDMHSNLDIANFTEQLELLHYNGYETLTLTELALYLEGSKEISDKSVVITFDDGSKTIAEYAYPVMEEYDVQGISYMISGRIEDERKPYSGDPMETMSWDEMYDMEHRIEIGGHTHNLHYRDDDRQSHLVTKPREEVEYDLNKDFELLGEPRSFAYPYGRYTEETIEIIEEIGYELAFTTKTGRVLPGDPLFELTRYDIHDGITAEEFSEFIGIVQNYK
ncbi:polysaccharide deacetylase family protein [Geomicrobium sp. JCM 19055]|uniref:polysaccharide deacetylase family protein n=1 Tax=Geomicrobium sp. JCM 19055 TaxID=1460649 RepID=UPI00045ED99E|nr:polysaccharide deacetylase family protein [Geomicrobium sp. JCM 19055]GAJ97364.1 polysaccharide deacetylase [Geomicrobium sp. JCM 19055]